MSGRRVLGRQFFHVSKHDFQPGDTVLPRSELGRELSNEGATGDADHVFMHDDIHAAVHGWGHILSQADETPVGVFEVKPVGKKTVTAPWEGMTDDYEIRAKRATVVRRLGTRYPDGRWDGPELDPARKDLP